MPLPRRAALVALIACLFSACAAYADETRPNVVVFLADDQGWGDLSLSGNTNLSTPRIDSLARDGAQFERFFVCPVCSPTRAEFFTGRYHPRGGVYSTSTGGERLDLDEATIAEVFRAAGYATAAFGKWHSGTQYPYHPRGRGFDEYYGFCSGHWGEYFNPSLEHNGQHVRGQGYITDDLTDRALQFIEASAGRPFFCYLPYNTPHSPMQVPERFFARFRDAPLAMRHRDPDREDIEKTRAALAMVENIDWNVGRVLDKLDELELSDNTIVVYFSDNGPNGARWNGRMKGQKGSTDEGGVRSPLLIRYPGHVRAGTDVTQIAAAIDLLPTLAELAGAPLSVDKPLDGRSLAPLLAGQTDDWPADRLIFSHWAGRVSVRSQQYRLDHAGHLFDMTADPEQRDDVAAEQPEVARRLASAVDSWRSEMLPGLRDDDRPFPIGHTEFPVAWLPARDGVAHGGVERSARAPNCSFYTNWRTVDDRITWDVEAATAGRYEAVLYYTCPADDVGAAVELRFDPATGPAAVARATIREPFDPPLRGAEHDRVSRGSESYVKDFKPLSLGAFDLPAGRGVLTLQATDVPGRTVADVRCVRLTLQTPDDGATATP